MPVRFSILFLAVLLTCSNPFEASEAVRYDPPQHYAVWWVEVQECSGVQSTHERFKELSWYRVEGPLVHKKHGNVIGLYFKDEVYVSVWWVNNEFLVKHEMLHAMGKHHTDPVWEPCNLRYEGQEKR
jgi:hypothetical protein